MSRCGRLFERTVPFHRAGMAVDRKHGPAIMGLAMRKCWYCGRDNEESAVSCSECGRELSPESASEVDPQLQDPELALKIVGTFRTVVDASAVKMRLEAAGIEAC